LLQRRRAAENLLAPRELKGSMTKSVTLGSDVPLRWGAELALKLTEPSVHSLHFGAAAMAIGPATTVASTARATVPVTATSALFNLGIVISLGFRAIRSFVVARARGVHVGQLAATPTGMLPHGRDERMVRCHRNPPYTRSRGFFFVRQARDVVGVSARRAGDVRKAVL
jgi:hypothetical protein